MTGIRDRKEITLSPWVTLVTKTVSNRDKGREEVFHSLKQRDYATVLAVNEWDEVVLVEQFRPAVERATLELPGGLVDAGEHPEVAARRELKEETGLATQDSLIKLGVLTPDNGRLENRLWCYMAKNVRPVKNWCPEVRVTVRTMSRLDFKSAIVSGTFDHALHIATVGLAVLLGEF